MNRSAFTLVILFAASAALAMSPLEKNDEQIDEGMTAFDKGDYENALKHFDSASTVHPSDARAQFNRGTSLHKLHRNDDAKEAFRKAEELDREGTLKNKIHYNLGNVAAEDSKREDAIAEYRKALKVDPNDQLSRHNMEVIMKNLPPKDPPSADGGKPNDAGMKDSGIPDSGTTDAGRDAGNEDGGGKDAGRQDGGADGGNDGGTDGGKNPGDAGQGDGGSADGGNGDKDKDADGGTKGDKVGDAGADGGSDLQDGGSEEASGQLMDGGMSKKDAEKLLDAFKSSEKNMQLWKFRQKTQKNDNHGKDW